MRRSSVAARDLQAATRRRHVVVHRSVNNSCTRDTHDAGRISPAICGVLRRPPRERQTLWYARRAVGAPPRSAPSGAASPPSSSVCSASARSRSRCREHELEPIWNAVRSRACARRSRQRPTTSGSRRCGRSRVDGDARASAPAEELRAWVAERFAARPRPPRRPSSSDDPRRSTSARRPSPAPRHPAPPCRTRRLRPRSHRSRVADPRSTRSSRSTSSSSATPTASPTRRRSRSPNSPARPTTRSSSTGHPGVGKTHLLHAVGNYVRSYGDGLTVRYTTVEHFTNDFVASLHRASAVDALQGPLPPRRRPAHRRRPVPRVEGQDRGGVLPHLQRAARHGQPARPDVRPPARRSRSAWRTACASASRPAWSPRSRPPTSPRALTVLRKRVQHDGLALDDAGVARPHRRAGPEQHPRARGRADPRRGLRLAHRPPGHRRPRRGGPRRPLPALADPPRLPRPPTVEQVVAATAAVFGLTLRRAPVRRPHRTRLLASPGRDVPRTRAHRRHASRASGRHFGGRNHTTVMHACSAPPTASHATPKRSSTIRQRHRDICRPAVQTERADRLLHPISLPDVRRFPATCGPDDGTEHLNTPYDS